MSDLLPSSFAVALATIEAPSSAEETEPHRHLIGIALFEAEEHTPGEFVYRYCARAIPSGSSEDLWINWLKGRLPAGQIAIGWRLAEDVVPALLDVAREAAPDDARIFLDALAALFTINAGDPAGTADIAGRSFRELYAAGRIPCWPMPEDELSTVGSEIDLLGMLATTIVATWRDWAQDLRPNDPVPARFAEAVLASWIVDHDGSIQLWRSEEDA